MLTGLLFCSLVALFALLLVPGEDAAPAAVTYDFLRRSMEEHYIPENRKPRLEILGRKLQDVTKSGLLIGTGLGLLGIVVTLKRWHWLAILAGIALFFAGLLLTRFGVNREFKKWQARVLDDVPNLISFAPAFLKTGGVSLRRAISLTLPFLAGPLGDEIWMAIDRVERTGNARDAFDELSRRIGHPCMDSICQRMSTAWDASPSPDLFDDLSEQLQDVEEIAAAGSTAASAGLAALICVIGLLGIGLVFGYPAWQCLASKLTAGFGL
jgi:hypothetical protein